MAPRITADTVAEHRAQQQAAILAAARRLLVGDGSGLTLGAVAQEAGLARTSLYQYFGSLNDLLDALVLDLMPRWAERVVAEMDVVEHAGEKVLAYVSANLDLVAEGEHAVIRGLATFAPPQLTEASKAMHDRLRRPLDEALGGDSLAAEFVQGWVYQGSRMIEEGRDREQVGTAIERLLRPFCERLP